MDPTPGNGCSSTAPRTTSREASRNLRYSTLIQLTLWAVHLSYGVFLIDISDALGGSRAAAAGVISISTLVTGFASAVTGWLTNRFGARSVTMVGTALFVLGLVWAGFSSKSWHVWLALGFVAGLGLSATYVPLTVHLAGWYTTRRGWAMGVLLSGSGIGGMIGPMLSARLLELMDWRTAYHVLALVVATIAIPSSIRLSRPTAVVMKRNTSLASFFPKESQFARIYASYSIHGFFGVTILTHLVAYLHESGISPSVAATILAASGISGIIGSFAAGPLADRFGANQSYRVGFFVSAAALLMLALRPGLETGFLGAVLFGLGFYGIGTILPLLIAGTIEPSRLGPAMGSLEVGWAIGAAAGSALAGLAFDRFGTYIGILLLLAALSVFGGVSMRQAVQH